MKDKSKLVAICLVIITIIVVIVANLGKTKEGDKNKILIVRNNSDFYTVDSCIYRTITYIESGNKDDLLLVLSDTYKKENQITSDNVLEVFSNISENSQFSSRKMYYEEINDNLTKFYVYGYLEKNQIMDDSSLASQDKKNLYFIVYLDNKNKIFSVEPYTGEIFEGGATNG